MKKVFDSTGLPSFFIGDGGLVAHRSPEDIFTKVVDTRVVSFLDKVLK